MRDQFTRAAAVITRAVGSPFALVAAGLVILVWAVTGPLFGFSDTWQLVINTGTTIVTFLMVFVIQASQNRDSKALHLKLDEVIRSLDDARNDFVSVETATEEELKAREEEMAIVAQQVAEESGHPEAEGTAKVVGRAIARTTAGTRVRRTRKRSTDKAGSSRKSTSTRSNGKGT
jgi:low affinity Fe/Cu permease